jgi:predicted small secreted protein
MKNTLKGLAVIAAITLTFALASCGNGTTSGGGKPVSHAGTFEDPIPLTEGVWADGNIPTSDGEQWFKFTASADTHYIHFAPGTMSSVYVQLYDTAGTETGDRSDISFDTIRYISRTVTTGSVYYIKVTPRSGSRDAYKIAFNTSSILPAITLPTENVTTLTEGVWSDGSITGYPYEQWFRFTATANIHYIHFAPDTLNNVDDIQVYDAAGTKETGERYDTYTSQTVTTGSVYYIKVATDRRGTFKMTFNTSSTAPAVVFTLPTENVTTLTEGVWADGDIPTSNGEQWFTFTASADTQYIHFAPGTLTSVYVQLYDAAGTATGDRTILSTTRNTTSRTVTTGSVYYIRVVANGGNRGAYKIAFNTIAVPPSPTLTEGVWADGDILAYGGEQWFTFTATADTHYIHFAPGTLDRVYVQLYDAAVTATGDRSFLSASSTSTSSRTVSNGSVYYIKVTAYDNQYRGAYKIAFTASSARPPITITLPTENITTLTEGEWADGNIPTSDGEQWFRFTASANTQYIHFYQGTLAYVYVQLYDAAGTEIGRRGNLSEYGTNTSRTVTTGSVYYIKVTPDSSPLRGAYQIGFNTSTTRPPVTITLPTENITTLTEGEWSNGNIPRNGEQWFTFTASANTHYIHFDPGTLPWVYVQLHDAAGTETGGWTFLANQSPSTVVTVTSGSVYYIKVWPYRDSDSGDYKLAFNTSDTAPSP